MCNLTIFNHVLCLLGLLHLFLLDNLLRPLLLGDVLSLLFQGGGRGYLGAPGEGGSLIAALRSGQVTLLAVVTVGALLWASRGAPRQRRGLVLALRRFLVALFLDGSCCGGGASSGSGTAALQLILAGFPTSSGILSHSGTPRIMTILNKGF